MIQKNDLKIGLRVVDDSGRKSVIARLENLKGFTIPQLTKPAIKVKSRVHVLVSNHPTDHNIITWGYSNDKIFVDLEYYNNLLKK